MSLLNVKYLACAGLVLSMMACVSPALSNTLSSVESNKKKVAAMLAAWRAGTGGLLDLLAADSRWTIVGTSVVAGTYTGKQHIVDDVLGPFGARFAKSADRFKPVEVKGIYGDGDMVVVWWDGAGTTNDGKPYSNSYAWFLTMRDGMIADATAFFDGAAFNEMWARVPAGN
jgi:ketosteroid isomerase-like protein